MEVCLLNHFLFCLPPPYVLYAIIAKLLLDDVGVHPYFEHMLDFFLYIFSADLCSDR